MQAVTEPYDWSVVIFGMNEAPTIAGCLASVEENAAGRRVHVTVLLNGTTDDSAEVLRAHHPRGVTLAVQGIAKADKANAINQYVHAIRPRARLHFLMDAYVTLRPGALAALEAALDARPGIRAASGLPRTGRSAAWFRAQVLEGGRLNGNVAAVREEFLDRMAAGGLRLPLHTYRVDGLLGSMVAHDLDALGRAYQHEAMIGVEGSGYDIRPLSALRWRDIRRQFRREINQARGMLEFAAIKSVIYAGNYAALPADADDMLRDWLASHRLAPEQLRERLFRPLALRRLRRPRPPTPPEALVAKLLHRSPAAEPALTA